MSNLSVVSETVVVSGVVLLRQQISLLKKLQQAAIIMVIKVAIKYCLNSFPSEFLIATNPCPSWTALLYLYYTVPLLAVHSTTNQILQDVLMECAMIG